MAIQSFHTVSRIDAAQATCQCKLFAEPQIACFLLELQDGLAGHNADEVMSAEEEAAITLMQINRACSPAQQHLLSIEALAQDMPAHMLDMAATAAGVLAASCIPHADLIAACNYWAQQFYAQQAALDAFNATNSPGAFSRTSPVPSTLPVDPSSPAPNSDNGLDKPSTQRTGSSSCAGAVSPLRASPFAPLARLARQSTPAQEVLTQAVQHNGALGQTAAFANVWTEQVMNKLPRIKTKAATQRAVQSEPQYATAAMAVDLDAACGSPRLSALSAATTLRPGLLAQCLNADPATPSSLPSVLGYAGPHPGTDGSVVSARMKLLAAPCTSVASAWHFKLRKPLLG
jgi:hypothetical protein